MRRRGRPDERGAVALFTAVVMSVVLVMAAFGIDLGMQRVVRRDMQSLADAVAFDLARQLDGRTAAAILASSTWSSARTQSIARNGPTLGSTPTVAVELGTVDSSYTFTSASGATVPTAVRVEATASVDFSFTTGSGSATRSAVAVARAQGCYKLGSWGARLGTTSDANLLYRVLAAHGIGSSVSVATYQSLVGAHLDLTALSTALGLGSPESMATASVSLAALLDAAATVIASNGSSATQVSALNTIKGDLGSLGGNAVSLANLFSVAPGAGSGLSAAANLADLVIGSILVADNNAGVSLDLTSDVPGVSSLTTSVGLTQAAKTACGFVGSTPNTSNQVTVSTTAGTLTSNQNVLTSLVSGIANLGGIKVNPASGPVTLTVTTAAARSTLDALSCSTSVRSATVGTTGGLLSAELVVPVSVEVSFLLGLLPTTVKGTIRARLAPTGTVSPVTISVPDQSYDMPYSNSGSQAQLPAPTVDATITAGSLTPSQATDVLNAVATTVVAPMVTALNSALLGPLSDLSGLRTAGADVLLLDHPTCTSPALRG
jgi:uncharacterized membrane protein